MRVRVDFRNLPTAERPYFGRGRINQAEGDLENGVIWNVRPVGNDEGPAKGRVGIHLQSGFTVTELPEPEPKQAAKKS